MVLPVSWREAQTPIKKYKSVYLENGFQCALSFGTQGMEMLFVDSLNKTLAVL